MPPWCIMKAASENSHLACDYLGWLYMTGTSVAQDEAKGLEYYLKAAELGNGRSMMALGYAYEHGQGTETDLSSAESWYEKAALAGRADALAARSRLREAETP